jgi:hypothetical protein
MTSSRKHRLFREVLPELGKVSAYFSFNRIKDTVAVRNLGIGDASLRVYLNEALRKGVVHDAGRGWYSRLSEPVPLDPKPVAKLAAGLAQRLPLLDFACWSTAQINPWMHHLLAQPVAFLYVPGDMLESVGETLTGLGWKVAANPSGAEASDRVRPGPKMLVLRPTRSKQPAGAGHQAPIEKILVDLVEETASTSLMDGSEAQAVVAAVLSHYLMQVAALQSYAGRRGAQLQALATIN